jgi:hypothetical protein
VKYPIERILQERRAYLTNHCSYMIALAIAEGVDTIGLWGCQYGVESERQVQRGSLEYWLGFFEGLGGHVILPGKKNTLLAFPQGLYGYESHDEHGNLTGDYARMTEINKSKTDKDGKLVTLTPIPAGEKRPNVRALPNAEEIAWARRELLPLVPQP